MDADKLAASLPQAIPIPAELRRLCDWLEEHGYPVSGGFEIREHDDETIRCWFGTDKAVGSLGQFGAGPDGSLYCVWRDPNGKSPIVHMGSEGQNNFVLASNAIDFLRLLAIGYDEIGFDDLSNPPSTDDANPAFQDWVSSTFTVSIPRIGIEITEPAQASHSDFQKWIDARCG